MTDRPSEVSSAGSADSISASSGPVSTSPGNARPTSSADASCGSTGPTSPATPTSDRSEWPTPTVPNGGRAPKGGMSMTGMTPDGKKRQVDLQTAVRDWPSPQTSDANGARDLTTDRGTGLISR